MQSVGGTAGGVVQIGAQAQKEIIGGLDSPLVGFAQPVFANELVRAQ